MLTETRVSLRGNVATAPTLRATPQGAAVSDFRLAVTERTFSREEQRYVDAGTSWYRVTAWRSLASNVAGCLAPGTPVLVEGRLRVRDYEWEGKDRTTAEVEADAVGVELTFGTATYLSNRRRREPAAPGDGADEGREEMVDGREEAGDDASVPGAGYGEDVGTVETGRAEHDDDAAYDDGDPGEEDGAPVDGRLVGAAHPF
ncbi:single-stranded DNA-binding protein [Aquipuribacter sp. SD81]|uniref:single-stranded DNA-binding protein n=1 Tax=Aquipuribacter sp. SD81 TaxID=3127703 RepID=UPI00301A5BB8